MDKDFLAEEEQIKTLCDHCGNITLKDLISCAEIENPEGIFVEHRLYRCTICYGIILEKTIRRLPEDYQGSKQPRFRSAAAKKTGVEQLWPSPQGLPLDVPARIRAIYDEARTVKRSPSSFVVQIGRALEAIAKDKGAEGRSLNDRLNWLVSQELLPRVLGEMGHISRIFRNWGAHDAESDVGEDDVEIVDQFFHTIIEYIYVAPTKVSRVQELIKKRSKKVKEPGQ